MQIPVNGDQLGSSWFTVKSLNFENEEKINGNFEVSECEKMTQTLTQIIEEEVKTNLNNDYSKLWVGGTSQGGWQTFHTILTIEHILGGLLVINTGFEPLVDIEKVSEDKKSIPLIYF